MRRRFKRFSNVLLMLARLPWPVGVIVALITFALFFALTPLLPPRWAILGFTLQFAFPTSAILWAALSFWHRSHGGAGAADVELAEGESTSPGRLSWPEFEMLVAETFRRRGYSVSHNLSEDPFGGFDLLLRRNGKTCLVQCKYWHTRTVGIRVVRDLSELLRIHHAESGCIATAGSFTEDARQLAADSRIELIDGPRLLEMILEPDHERAGNAAKTGASSDATPRCPECGKAMVRKRAKRDAGEEMRFWACSGYPECGGTRVDGSGERRRTG